MEEKVKRLIQLYEEILHGANDKYGLFDCYDAYYAGCWDEQLAEVETLKDELEHGEKLHCFGCGDEFTPLRPISCPKCENEDS